MFCADCTLVQLSSVPPSKVVFADDYNYLTGSTNDAVRYFSRVADLLIDKFDLSERDKVLDIGSNDGTFLRFLQVRGIEVIGVDPAPKPAAIANKNGVRTICRPFEDCVEDVAKWCDDRLRLVTAFNVLAHTDRVHLFLDGVRKLLSNDKTVFMSQSHYLPVLIDERQYDTIYHEHARYYTATSLKSLLNQHGLHLFDAEESDYYGGSIMAYAAPTESSATKRLGDLLSRERRFAEFETYAKFARGVEENRLRLRGLLEQLKREGNSIAGVGAPMKSSTLLNYCGIDSQILDYVTEVNPLKINTYTPGTHIKVVSEGTFFKSPPHFALILSWNVADSIIEKFKVKGYKGSFIIPIPEPRLVK